MVESIRYCINLMKYLFVVLLLVGLTVCLSPEPIPSCTAPRFIPNEIPISLHEVQTFNLDDYFTGFNLEFNLTSSAPDFVYLTQKTDTVKNYNRKQPGLKSYHLETDGNRWGRTLITLSEDNWVSKIRWGAASANETIPDLTEQVTVESEKNIWCYDAIWIRDQHLAIVDCAKAQTFGLSNIFIYVNTTSQLVLPKTLKNDMYVSYTTITRRRMVMLREDGYNYLIRAYYGDAVDVRHRDNTYLQILTFTDPFKPRTIKVLDRSFLHQDRLTITDFKLYMGNMYLLDYHSGVIIFDFTPHQQILITGRYRTDSGYLRMGVYSGNLDNEVLFALANHHSIYEVDFTNQLRPQIITKYSIMSNSTIHSVWVNEEYVFAQISANVTSSTNGTTWYNSSIVFSRNTRTYLNAYQILEHNSANVIIDIERSTNLALVIEETYMRLYRINKPMLSVRPTNNNTLGKEYDFAIIGLSVNTYNNHSLVCTHSMKFKVVDINSMDLYPTGLKLPEVYYANYPGELFIPLNRYILGPNVTWGVHETQHPNMSAYWILQQNETILHWPKQPSLGKITFLRQEQFDSNDDTQLWLYTQDALNITHIVQCDTVPYTIDVKCQDNGYFPSANYTIANLTAHRWDQYEGRHVHMVAFVYEQFPNQVILYEAETKKQIVKPIKFSDEPYEGRVTNIEFVGHYLAVLMRYTKQILFFDMKACVDHQEGECKELHRIDSLLMDRLGVNYFAPVDIYISDFHPGVLFIQNMDRVIILSITRAGPRLLAQIESPGSKEFGFFKFKIGIAQDHLVLVNPPNLIEEHSLAELYTKRDAPLNKVYPIYNYEIPDKFDLDFSDEGNLIYITAIDKKLPADHNSVILVYRTGYPSVAAFYDVFHINGKYDDMLIDATGVFGDYVSVALGSMLLMFRQYEFPILIFQDSFHDFDFNVSYTNDPEHSYKFLAHANVKVANYPQDLIVNDSRLNNTNFLSDIVDYQNDKKLYVLNDTNWYNGSVVNYTLKDCSECGNKIKVINHIEHKRNFHASMDMDDYVFTAEGGIVQQFQSLITMRHNGSINQYVSMPAVLDGENCKHITYSWMYDYGVSACQHNEEVFLYMTSLISDKPFVNGPHPSAAKRVASIQTIGDIFIIADVDEEPSRMSREGGVLIYSMNHDITAPELFDEIDFIDSDDLIAAQGWTYGENIFIGNAHLVFTNETEIYRLAVTELRYGVFFVDFRWRRGMRELEITKIQFMDLREELFNAHLPMPNSAFFEAVTVSKEYYDPTFKYWDVELIVTTRNFHILQVNCNFDKTGTLIDHKIAKIFYGYGYYEVTNYIKSFDGYFAVVYKLPTMYEPFDWLSKQVLAVYDTRERWGPMQVNDIPAFYMLGGMTFPHGRVTFDFNFTFRRNETDPFRDIGLLVLNSRQAVIRETLIHDYIAIQTEQGIYQSQNAKLVAWNDYSKHELPLNVVIYSNHFPGWAIALIVIGCLAIGALGGFIGWRIYLKRKGIIAEEPIKKSLLEDEAQGEDYEDDDEQDSDDEDQQDDEQQEEGKATKKSEAQPTSIVTPTGTETGSTTNNVHGASINRQTYESVGEEQESKDTEPGEKPPQPQQQPKVEEPKVEESPATQSEKSAENVKEKKEQGDA